MGTPAHSGGRRKRGRQPARNISQAMNSHAWVWGGVSGGVWGRGLDWHCGPLARHPPLALPFPQVPRPLGLAVPFPARALSPTLALQPGAAHAATHSSCASGLSLLGTERREVTGELGEGGPRVEARRAGAVREGQGGQEEGGGCAEEGERDPSTLAQAALGFHRDGLLRPQPSWCPEGWTGLPWPWFS